MKILRILGLLSLISITADAQAPTSVQWGAQRTVSPWNVGVFDNANIFQSLFTVTPTGGAMTLSPSVTTALGLTGVSALSIGSTTTGFNIGAGTTFSSGLTYPGAIVTGSFTATGLVTNADLVNTGWVLNSTPMILGGGPYTITAAASSIAPGVTTIIGGTNGSVEVNNSGVLAEQSSTGSGDIVRATAPTLISPTLDGSVSFIGELPSSPAANFQQRNLQPTAGNFPNSYGEGPINVETIRTGGGSQYGDVNINYLTSASVGPGDFDGAIKITSTNTDMKGGQVIGIWAGANTPSSHAGSGQTYTGGVVNTIIADGGNRWTDFGLVTEWPGDGVGQFAVAGFEAGAAADYALDGLSGGNYPGSGGFDVYPGTFASITFKRWWIDHFLDHDAVMPTGWQSYLHGGTTSGNSYNFTHLDGDWINGLDFSNAVVSGCSICLAPSQQIAFNDISNSFYAYFAYNSNELQYNTNFGTAMSVQDDGFLTTQGGMSVGGAVSMASLDTSGSIGGSLCRTVGGDVLYESGGNCFSSASSVPASGLTGSTLASGVTSSSLTSVGTLTGGNIGNGFGSINLTYTNTFAVGVRAPLFIWQNPSGTSAAGTNAGLQIWIGNNPTATPGANDTVNTTLATLNGNGRGPLYTVNLLTGQSNLGTGFIDQNETGLEADMYTDPAWQASTDPYAGFVGGGSYLKNDMEFFAEGGKLSAAMVVWANIGDGSTAFYDGLAVSRVIDCGLCLYGNPNGGTDTGLFFGKGAIAFSGFTAMPVFAQGISTAASNFDFDNRANFDDSITLDSGISASEASFLVLADQGTPKWEIRKNSDNTFNLFDAINSAIALHMDTSGNMTLGESGKTLTANSGLSAPFFNASTGLGSNEGYYIGSGRIIGVNGASLEFFDPGGTNVFAGTATANFLANTSTVIQTRSGAATIATFNSSGLQVNAMAGTGSRPACLTSTGQLEAGSLSAGLVTCP